MNQVDKRHTGHVMTDKRDLNLFELSEVEIGSTLCGVLAVLPEAQQKHLSTSPINTRHALKL